MGRQPIRKKLDHGVTVVTGSGSTGPFTTPKTGSDESFDVWVGGAWQSPAAYSVTGTNLTMSEAVPTGMSIVIKTREGRQGTAVPNVGMVSTSMIQDGAFDLSNLADGTAGFVVQFVGGNPTGVDPIAESREDQRRIMINSMRIAENSGQAIYGMKDGISDVFNDATGYDAAGSTNETFFGSGITNTSLAMVLLSEVFTASVQPDEAYVVVQHKALAATTINTDIIVAVSRDNGVTFTNATLVDDGTLSTEESDGTHKIFSATVDISGQPAGTSMLYRITTTTVDQEIHGVGLQWR